ncbi:hypothetical protein EG329_011938 [Mollisiaceae sp. DMI_Dod_QoI]|nr:hypothetical protein EG329_011938 [Helotiales sp. DMI_Dod_QoI]
MKIFIMAHITSRTVYRRNTSKINALDVLNEPRNPLKATEILIRVRAISLNYRDVNILNGTNPWPVSADGIPCSDAAGEVIAVGAEVSRFKIGDRVSPIFDQKSITGLEQSREWLGGEVDGVLSDYVVFSEEKAVLVPGHLSWAEAACLPCAGLTAWNGLAVGGELASGKTVLIQGTGGVSLMALKLASAAGCKVIISSSSDEKLEKVRKIAGSKRISTINYNTTPEWEHEVLRLNDGNGVDIVLENGGTSSLLRSFAATSKRGIISQIGYLGRQDPKDLDGLVSILIDKTITLRGINVGSRLEFEALNRVVSVNEMSFEDIIDKKFSFGETEEAFKRKNFPFQHATYTYNLLVQEQMRIEDAFDEAMEHCLDLGISDPKRELLVSTPVSEYDLIMALDHKHKALHFWATVSEIAGLIHRHPIIRAATLDFIGITDERYRKTNGHLAFYSFTWNLFAEATILVNAFDRAKEFKTPSPVSRWTRRWSSNLGKDPRTQRAEDELLMQFNKEKTVIKRCDFMSIIREASRLGRSSRSKEGGSDGESKIYLKDFPRSSNALKRLKKDLRKLRPIRNIVYPEAIE